MATRAKKLPAASAAGSSLKPLMTFEAGVRGEIAIARPAKGSKLSVCYFDGGRFAGPRLRGSVLPGGGDWASCRSADWVDIDVRSLLKTDDGALIYLQYQGLWRAAPGLIGRVVAKGGEKIFRPADHYLRVTARFETDSRRYAWLNGVIAVGIGSRTRTGIRYEFHELL